MKIQKVLKLTKPRIIRCFELIILAKLDPKDPVVHQRFGQEIKKKLQQQLTKNILAPYFQIENFQPQSSMFINPYQTNHQEMVFGQPYEERKPVCCQGDGMLFCLKDPRDIFGVQMQQGFIGGNHHPNAGSSLISKNGGGHAG